MTAMGQGEQGIVERTGRIHISIKLKKNKRLGFQADIFLSTGIFRRKNSLRDFLVRRVQVFRQGSDADYTLEANKKIIMY